MPDPEHGPEPVRGWCYQTLQGHLEHVRLNLLSEPEPVAIRQVASGPRLFAGPGIPSRSAGASVFRALAPAALYRNASAGCPPDVTLAKRGRLEIPAPMARPDGIALAGRRACASGRTAGRARCTRVSQYVARLALKNSFADDLTFLLEGAAAIRLPDAARTAELRRRYVALFLGALASPEPSGLPGPAPTPGELNWRWRPSPG